MSPELSTQTKDIHRIESLFIGVGLLKILTWSKNNAATVGKFHACRRYRGALIFLLVLRGSFS